MTIVNHRNYTIRQNAKGWHFDGLYRDYGYFNTLKEAQNAADDDSCHPNWPLLKYKPDGYQEEGRKIYYLHFFFGWVLFFIFPINYIVPFIIYCHLLMWRIITSFLRPVYRKNFILWIGFIGVHVIVIAGILAATYFTTRLPLGTLVKYEVAAQTQ